MCGVWCVVGEWLSEVCGGEGARAVDERVWIELYEAKKRGVSDCEMFTLNCFNL